MLGSLNNEKIFTWGRATDFITEIDDNADRLSFQVNYWFLNKEEYNFYNYNAPTEWLYAIKPLGTNPNKDFIQDARVLIAIFEQKFA